MLVKIVKVINFINIITFIFLFKPINKCISLNVRRVKKCTTFVVQPIFSIPKINYIKFQLN